MPCPAPAAHARHTAPPSLPPLWLVRHAPVPAAAGQCYGRSDWAADAEATAAAARALAAQCPQGMAVRVSPLRRCRQLADALAALRPDLPMHADARLAEMDFGAWEGRAWAGIARAQFDAWMADFADAAPGGGETVRQLMHRVGAVWDAHCTGAQPALWVTHAGVMRAALLLARGVRLPACAADWPDAPLPFGGCLRLLP